MKTKKIEVGTKSYSLNLGIILKLRKELNAHKHAQLAALTMEKIVSKIFALGFEKQADKLKTALGSPTNGLYQDITDLKKQQFVDAITAVWAEGYALHEAYKKDEKAQKRTETLARLAEKKKQNAENMGISVCAG